jgi:DNA-binding transcriptional LysR family regulator
MREVENRLLRYFVAVAEEQHFARAAERLGITPPTLTHQIKKLESGLKARLLRRRGHTKVVVTAASERVLAHAREVLRQVDEIPVIAQQAERGELGHLQIGFVASVYSGGLLQSWIGAFEQANPAIHIATQRMSPMAQIAGIMRNELDAGFARTPNKYPLGVRGFEVYRQAMVLALHSKHPLARHKAISPALLAREPFVSFPTELDLGFPGYTEAVARAGNFIPRVIMRHEDSTTVLASVGLGRGIAVVAELLMKTTNTPDVVFRNIAVDPAPQTSIAFVYGSDPSPSAKLLIRRMQRHALRNGGEGAAPRHDHDRIIIPCAHNLPPYPELRV